MLQGARAAFAAAKTRACAGTSRNARPMTACAFDVAERRKATNRTAIRGHELGSLGAQFSLARFLIMLGQHARDLGLIARRSIRLLPGSMFRPV